MMRRRIFRQVDVFTKVPFLGNPLAVVLDGNDLSTEEMQGFTRWTNLSEATFVLPAVDPKADYRVRIFTGSGELPFAGHPTLGTCHAWLEAGGTPHGSEIVQECELGLVRISRMGGRLAFAAPPRRRSGAVGEEELVTICQALGINRSDIIDHSCATTGRNGGQYCSSRPSKCLHCVPTQASLGTSNSGYLARTRSATAHSRCGRFMGLRKTRSLEA